MANIYVRSGAAGTPDGTTWATAWLTLTAALAGATNADTIWLASDHAESTVGAVTLQFPTSQGLRILSSNTTTTEPPTGLSTTASVAVGAAGAALVIRGFAYVYGVSFLAATAFSNSATMIIAETALPAGLLFDACTLALRTTASNPMIAIGSGSQFNNDNHFVQLTNCTLKFGATGQTLNLRHSRILFRGLSIDSAGSTPTTLISLLAGVTTNATIEASDLSGVAFTNLVDVGSAAPSTVLVRNCKMPASFALTTGTHPGIGGPIVKMHNCDSGSTNYRIAESDWPGSTLSDTAVYNDAGADDGSALGFSWKMTTSANALFPFAVLESPEMVKWNATTGSSKTVTVEIVHDGATAFKDNEIWLEVQYLSASGTPLGTIVSDRMANVLSTAAAQATSSATWTGDTGTGPNGSATWNTLKLECTFTPQKIGYIHAKVVMAVPSKTAYVDPLMTVA